MAPAWRTALLVSALALGACTSRFESPVGMQLPGGGSEPVQLPPAQGTSSALHSRLLLSFEYRNAIVDLFGARAAVVAAPPLDTALNGLTAVGAGQLSLGLSQLEAYEKSARAVSEAVLADPAAKSALMPCVPMEPADAMCMSAVAATLAPRVLRHPQSQDELDAWTQLGVQAALQEGSFDVGVQWLLTGLLLSPEFLYLNEIGRPHPTDPSLRVLTDHELASRLSFFLSGSTPPDWLLLRAQRGELEDAAQLREVARRLLDGPRGDAAIVRLMEELFGVRELDAVAKDSTTFPGWSPALSTSMQEEFRLVVSEAARAGDFRALFNQPTTFVDARLAAHYGLSAPQSSGFVKVTLDPASGRAGVLAAGAFLARTSHPVSSSPTLRGKFVRERLLCQPVDAPPSNVIPSLPPDDGKVRTTRQRHEIHMELASCSGCHTLMDPLGFALEHFDATGAWRATENGLAIDATGKLDQRAFDGAAELGSLLASDPRVASCLLRTFYRQAVGRLEAPGEEPFLEERQARFDSLGGALKPWLVDLVAAPEFRRGLVPEGAPR